MEIYISSPPLIIGLAGIFVSLVWVTKLSDMPHCTSHLSPWCEPRWLALPSSVANLMKTIS
jgi:hypothetical protein